MLFVIDDVEALFWLVGSVVCTRGVAFAVAVGCFCALVWMTDTHAVLHFVTVKILYTKLL